MSEWSRMSKRVLQCLERVWKTILRMVRLIPLVITKGVVGKKDSELKTRLGISFMNYSGKARVQKRRRLVLALFEISLQLVKKNRIGEQPPPLLLLNPSHQLLHPEMHPMHLIEPLKSVRLTLNSKQSKEWPNDLQPLVLNLRKSERHHSKEQSVRRKTRMSASRK